MCGLVGFAAKTGRPADRIESALAALGHRGPDGHGVFADEQCGLAHSRLAIVDVVGSPQPIFGPGKVGIVNGEIYNHLTLKSNRKIHLVHRL